MSLLSGSFTPSIDCYIEILISIIIHLMFTIHVCASLAFAVLLFHKRGEFGTGLGS